MYQYVLGYIIIYRPLNCPCPTVLPWCEFPIIWCNKSPVILKIKIIKFWSSFWACFFPFFLEVRPPEFSDFIRCHPISRPLVPLANFREPPSNSPFKITLWITFNKFRNLNRPQQFWKKQLLNSPFHIYTLTYMNHGQHIRRSQDYNFNPPLQTSNDIYSLLITPSFDPHTPSLRPHALANAIFIWTITRFKAQCYKL